MTILETKGSAVYWKALYLSRLWAYEVGPGNRMMGTLPATPASGINFFIGGVNLFAGIKKRVMDLSEGSRVNFERIIVYMSKVLIAQSSGIVALIRTGEEKGLKISIETVVSTGAVLTPRTRKLIKTPSADLTFL
ncbi:MAG: hypothetical protein QXI97_01630 [Nitrososphaerota archaeon]